MKRFLLLFLFLLFPLSSYSGGIEVISASVSNATLHDMNKETAEFSAAPINNSARPNYKWRIAYMQSGNYVNYDEVFVGIMLGLQKLKWLTINQPIPDNLIGKDLWDFMVKNVSSNYIELLPDAFYSNDWNDDITKQNRENLLSRKDIDLIIGAGTQAGQTLYRDENKIDTFIVSATDAVKSGFSSTREDSGKDGFNSHIDPSNYLRQLRIFHEVAKFKSLGIVYEDTENGRVYAGLEHARKVASQKGFNLVECKTVNDDPVVEHVYQSLLKCFKEFAEGPNKVDAIYFTEHSLNKEDIRKLAIYVNSKKIPSFSQSGEHEVRLGFMMSLSHSGLRNVGIYTAIKIAKTFNGAEPRKLTQYYEDPPRLSINLQAINEVGFIVDDYLKRALDASIEKY